MDWSGWVIHEDRSRFEACVGFLGSGSPLDYRQLAALWAMHWRSSCPIRVGLSGGQGAGKSTLGRLLERACAFFELKACVISIDDFYLTRAERQALAREVHPLFETRGPPGTHDVARCRDAIDGLATPKPIELPCFDKAVDDRVGSRSLQGPFDVIVLEGWCVSAEARSLEALNNPCNELEERADAEGIWRSYVNQVLAEEYQTLWGRLDESLFLAVPSLSAVRRWRFHQESERPDDRQLGLAEVGTFVAHYQGLTSHMLRERPSQADWTVYLGERHEVVGLTRRFG